MSGRSGLLLRELRMGGVVRILGEWGSGRYIPCALCVFGAEGFFF